MTVTFPSMCDSCIHKKGRLNACDAYPNGIPDKFTFGGMPHVDPDRDGGVVYSLRPDAEYELAQYIAFWNQPDLNAGGDVRIF